MAEVKVTIPSILASATKGEREVMVSASNVRDVISALASRYGQEFERRVMDPSGKPRRLLNIFVNGKNIRFLAQLETQLKNGDEVSLLPAVGGG